MDTSLKQFLKYAALNITGMLGISFYILADTYFIANGIGADGLSALNLAIPIYSFVHGFGLMLGTGGSTKYIIAKCQGEHVRADTIYTNSIQLGLIISLLFIFCGLFGSHALTTLLKADEALFGMTNTYLKVILLFAPFFITNEQLLAYVRSDGNPSLAMTAMVSGSIANIILDYLFIYSFRMGIWGAVLATGIAPIISMIVLSRHVKKESCGFRFIHSPIQCQTAKDVTILGIPSLIAEISTGIVMILFNLLIMQQAGNAGIAAYGIIANIALVTTAIFTGLAQGTQPLISQAHSTNNRELLQKYIRYAFVSGGALSLILYGLLFSYSAPITALFNNEAHHTLQTLGEKGMQLYFTTLPLTAFNIIICTIFTAAERPLPAHIISLLRGLVVILPLSLWMSLQFGLQGIWLTVTTTEFFTAIIAILIWCRSPLTKSPAS